MSPQAVAGLILAGGRARRMGGEDKGLLNLRGKPLAAWSFERLGPQVDELFISANRNQSRYQTLGAQVITDSVEGFVGPLAGFLTGLAAATQDWLVTAPCDSPLLADDYVQRMLEVTQTATIDAVVAHDGVRLQPVFILLHQRVKPSLIDFLLSGERKIDLWLERVHWRRADFSSSPQMFLNVNTPKDLEDMEKIVGTVG